MKCESCDKALVKKSADGKWRLRTKGVIAFTAGEGGISCEMVCPHCASDTALDLQSSALEGIIKAHAARASRPISFYVKTPTQTRETDDGAKDTKAP
jgi:hypothetical protein